MYIQNYQSIFSKIVKNRAIDLALLQYDSILNTTTKKLLSNEKDNANLTKDNDFEASFNFLQFKWVGNARNSNFRLSANTILNSLTNSSTNLEEYKTNLKMLSLNEILPFVLDVVNIPDSAGLQTASKQLENVILESKQLLTMQSNNTNSSILSKFIETYFSDSQSIKETFSNLLEAYSKNALTEKIYVSSDVDALEVLLFI